MSGGGNTAVYWGRAGLYMCGQVFPFPTFVLVCVFCLGRIMHQIGYTTGAPSRRVAPLRP